MFSYYFTPVQKEKKYTYKQNLFCQVRGRWYDLVICNTRTACVYNYSSDFA